MKKSLITLIGAGALCASTMGFAAGHDTGVYADIGAGYGKVNILGAGKNKGFSGTANLGYRFTPHLALEAGATSYQKTNYYRYHARNYNVHVAAKAIAQLNDSVDVFAKAGVAHVHNINKNHIAPYMGAGASYWFNPNLAATLQGELTTRVNHIVPAMYGATAGLTFAFN